MIAAHVYFGDNYYPMSGTGDYKESFYGPTCVEDAEEYVREEFPGGRSDWWEIIGDTGEGLREVRSGSTTHPNLH